MLSHISTRWGVVPTLRAICRCIALTAVVMLAGCVIAPGMRMATTAAPAANGTESGTGTATASTPENGTASGTASGSTARVSADASHVPITDIDATLLQQLRTRQPDDGSDASPLFAASQPYLLGPGDVLQITVWDHPELAAALGAPPQSQTRPADAPAGFVVDQSGNLQFPYAGSLHVAGLRSEQVHDLLVRKLEQVFRSPQVTVRVASYRSAQIYVDGEVHTPGAQPLNDIPMTLFEAVGRAGGFTASADQSRMVLIRSGVQYPLDLPRMLAQNQTPAKLVLKSGDLLRVSSRDENGVFVMGEINHPLTAIPMKTGVLTLSDALSQAGSLNVATSNAAQLYVIRGAFHSEPHVYHLDASSPVAMLLANQFELQPKDVIYVDSTGLARFSRVLAQLLPAIDAGLTAAVVTK